MFFTGVANYSLILVWGYIWLLHLGRGGLAAGMFRQEEWYPPGGSVIPSGPLHREPEPFLPLLEEEGCHESGRLRAAFWVLARVQFSSVTQSCLTLCSPMTAARQASLFITNSWSLLKLIMSIKLVMPSNHLILCRPLFVDQGSNQEKKTEILRW